MPPKRKTAGELKAEAEAAMIARIRESLVDWYPGKWAEENAIGPACHCGLRGVKEACTRHGPTDTDPVAAG
ncbi:hypothetical protein [Streptomyces hydrogenans]|uniref:Uncharacterized protein n=1 Tax=Streptomyces hydrogenans TaxID=1873719 RepID=A0ABQ3PJF3_9ACTN|nr:hypothetical protein [Streptomyces hydrogenans]GHF94516.1 hypothetical protein GCM10018784_02730 [Streptomyces hydrogenans]GHI25147.1 hypothetical protein Shyd_65180 [Streptomyces hydrogenans]